MQQYPRATPRATPAISSPHSNLARANNQREQLSDRSSDLDSLSYSDRTGGDGSGLRMSPSGERVADQSKDLAKLTQIIQHFFTKAALTIISARVDLPQSFVRDTNQVRSNKWFNLILDESDALAADVIEWAKFDMASQHPDSLVIEIYLDTGELARNRTLVLVDERGTKWDVCKILDAPGSSSTTRSRAGKNTQVVLERWKISLGDPSSSRGSTSDDPPPNVYKKAVVLFRALYSYIHLLPAWKFGRRIAKEPATLTSLRPMYRILKEEPTTRDSLTTPLYPTAGPCTETYSLEPTKSPVGSLSIQVTYRTNCDFRVNDSDALLSSHFMGIDDQYFRPSLGDTSGQEVPGSLPIERRWPRELPDRSQAYGSMSTFHRAGPGVGTSPLSALRAVRDITSESPSESPPQKNLPNHRTSQSSKSSLRSAEGAPPVQRRVSVSFQPFKAGSLSSSPALTPVMPSPASLGVRTSDISKGLAQARNRTSLTALPQTALRAPPQPSGEVAVELPSPGSPKAPPITRYSSSFGHRRSRISSGSAGASRTEDDNNSSVKGSQSSSNPPGSGLLAEGEGSSPGSVQTDEDQIADFLKLLDQKKDLRSFNRSDDASRDASTRRTSAALSKFQRLRESHTVLTDSLSSSMMLHRSSSSSSRAAPPLLAGNSVSTSSSPGKPVSPHTPHYPAIPSRLSANATVEESEPRSRHSPPRPFRGRGELSPGDNAGENRTRGHGSTPMDIPTSPQRYPLIRRSSSAAQRGHTNEEMDEFELRSTSLPLEDRPDLSLSELMTLQQPDDNPTQSTQRSSTMAQSDSRPGTAEATISSSIESHESSRRGGSGYGGIGAPFRQRLNRGGGRGSPSSFGGGSGDSSRAGRYGLSARPGPMDDDEPLVFTMSELGAHSRRSAEDAGEGAAAVPGDSVGPEPGSTGRGATRGGGSLW